MKLLFCIILLSALPASAETLTERIDAVARQLMCPVCEGQSVAESNSDLARDMRKTIRTKLEDGQSGEEIVLWFREKYGDTILAEPPMKGFNLVAWLLPAAATAAGGLFGVFFIRKNLRKP